MFNIYEMCGALEEKKKLNKDMHAALKNYLTNTRSKIDKLHYIKAKDYVHYYGRGWAEDVIPLGKI